jgi:hypothetical protein
VKYVNPWAATTVEALTDGKCKHVNIATENEEMLRRESFPQNNDDQNYELPPAGCVHKQVSEQAFERALHSQSVMIAPGPDKLTFGAIHMLWKWEKERIVSLTRAAIRTGRHPEAWKRASGVEIRKPAKITIQS